MEVKKLHMLLLTNDEHYHFMLDVKEIIDRLTPQALNIESQYNALLSLVDNEKIALHPVKKSIFTEQVDVADEARDKPTAGFFKIVDGMQNHFDPAMRSAAHNVMITLDSFIGITRLSYKEQTAETIKLIELLRGSLATDMATLGLNSWVDEIESKNNTFITLVADRYNELEGKTTLRMKDARVETDAAYKAIVKRIHALIELEGEPTYAPFITQLNLRIDSYNTTLAQRAAHNAKKAAGKKAGGEGEGK